MASPSNGSRMLPLFRMALMIGSFLLCWWALRSGPIGQVALPKELTAADKALKAGDTAKARAQFDQLLHAHPTDLALYTQILSLCETYKQWNLMVAYTQSALYAFKEEPYPVRAQLNILLSNAYQEAEPKRPQNNALYAAETAYQLDSNNPVIWNAYGYMLVDNDQKLPEATEMIRKALEEARASSDPNLKLQIPAMEDSYGWALCKQGHYKEAAEILLKALYDYPNGTPSEALKVSHYHLGAAYRQMEEFEEARQSLRSALYYDADYADAKEELAKIPQPADTASPTSAAPPAPKP